MKTDAEFDAYLTSQLDSPPLPDEGFTRAVVARMERRRRSRRSMLIAASGLAGIASAISMLLSPGPILPFEMTPGTIIATLLLVTLCSLVWIGTESSAEFRPADQVSDPRVRWSR
jgi:hypothetical protein